MKKTWKIFLTMLCFSLFAALFIVSASAENGISSLSVDTASAADSSALGAVDWFQSSVDGNYYLFLPNGVSKDSLTVWFQADAPVMCGETQLENGSETDVFASGSATLTCGERSYTVVVLESEGTGTIYIHTQSGSLAAIHADKNYKEPGEIRILDQNGDTLYNGALDYMKGRGNSTWLADKKPYNIKLDKKTDLFGMGKSKKWCLLANSSDASMLRNSISYDLAQNLGIAVTSDTVFVNLYVNGRYEGVYLLTEKVDVEENRINIYDLEGSTEDVNSDELETYPLAGAQNTMTWNSIKYAEIPNDPDEITGGYLLELEKIYRYVDEPSGFITKLGQAVVVKTPEYASKAQVEYISSYYQEFEDALYSPTGYNALGKHYSDYIDVESLAILYLVLEFGANFDGCSSSFYLYKDVGGKLTAGPLWDMDLMFGIYASNDLINHVDNLADPSLLYIQTCYIGNHNPSKKALLAQAFTHNEFQEEVERLWNEALPEYYDTFYQNITRFSDEVRSSAVMNAIRWNLYSTTNTASITNNYNNAVNTVRNYIDARYPFLCNVYASDTFFVKYDVGEYGTAPVHDTNLYRSGDEAVVLAAPASSDSIKLFGGWSVNPDGSGERYNAGDTVCVTGNTVLYAQWQQDRSLKGLLTALIRALNNFIAKIQALFGNLFSS